MKNSDQGENFQGTYASCKIFLRKNRKNLTNVRYINYGGVIFILTVALFIAMPSINEYAPFEVFQSLFQISFVDVC